MGNININNIRKKGFEKGTLAEKIEDYCRQSACKHTDGLIKLYNELPESHKGRYINSDLMKMVYPFYAKSYENRRLYNMCITNSAAVLTNEAYLRAILNADVKRCIYIIGPYGAGKSYFCQSLFNEYENSILGDSIVYEGSITPPAFGEKVQYAINNNVSPSLIVLNPTLELSLRNIKERAERVGRDVEKGEVVDKFSNLYRYLKRLIEDFPNIPYIIYNKKSNIPIDLNVGSHNLEDLYHGTAEEISREYDKITNLLNNRSHRHSRKNESIDIE